MTVTRNNRAFRLVAAGAVLMVGVFATLDAIANASQRKIPSIAVRMAMNPGPARARLSSFTLANKANPQAPRQARDLAIGALRVDASSSTAVRNLALANAALGDRASAGRAMTVAFRMSRRDVPTLFWFYEEAVKAGDAQRALYYLDLAFRVAPASREAAAPALTQALQHPDFRREYGKLFPRRPNWLPQYLFVAIDLPGGVENIARTIIEGHRLPEGAAYRDVEQRLLQRLLVSGRYTLAVDLYAATAAYDPAQLTSLAFTDETTSDGAIGWQLAEDPAVTGSFSKADGGIALGALIEPGHQAPFAYRLLRLAPGQYSISWQADQSAWTPGAAISVQALCGDDASTLSRSPWVSGAGSLPFTVARGCKSQVVQISGSAPENSGDYQAVLTGVDIAPAGTKNKAEPGSPRS